MVSWNLYTLCVLEVILKTPSSLSESMMVDAFPNKSLSFPAGKAIFMYWKFSVGIVSKFQKYTNIYILNVYIYILYIKSMSLIYV